MCAKIKKNNSGAKSLARVNRQKG